MAEKMLRSPLIDSPRSTAESGRKEQSESITATDFNCVHRLRTRTFDSSHHYETKRIMYVPHHTFKIVFAWAGTAWPFVMLRVELYFAMFLYCCFILLRVFVRSVDFSQFFHGNVSIFVTFLSSSMVFYLTFYNSQVYERYLEEWKCTQTAYGRINDLNLVLPSYLDGNSRARDTLIRLVNAYHHLVYMDGAGLGKKDQISTCIFRRMLTEQEGQQLIEQDCSTQMRVLIWVTQEVARCDINENCKVHINELLVDLRRNLAYLWSYDDQPIPFIYYHTMNTLVLIVVWLQSLANACSVPLFTEEENRIGSDINWMVAIWSFLMQCLYVMVVLLLRELTLSLFDPIGSSEIPAERYLNLLLAGCSKLSKYNSIARDQSGDDDIDFSTAYTTAQVLYQKKAVYRENRKKELSHITHTD